MTKKVSLGYDIGSSSVKASFIDIDTGKTLASAFSPSVEMKIDSPQNGWAEQIPEIWWQNLKAATNKICSEINLNDSNIVSIGISYQMHGLVMLDKSGNSIHPSIIWCDSRAVEIGEKAFNELGSEYCLKNYLNSPGNFTASKLKWVKENRPDVYNQIHKIMLPGDYIAYRLTNEIGTSISGLSEGVLWDFEKRSVAKTLVEHYGLENDFIAEILPTFGIQGKVTQEVANELGLPKGIPVAYRAGDQPNNAFSLNVLNPGEVATTAGTSGVVYGVTDKNLFDKYSRVNTFAHVNYTPELPMLGVLLCINGTGISNSWAKRMLGKDISYADMNKIAQEVKIGSDGVLVLPFGNGAERVLQNKNIGCQISGINFNNHDERNIFRAIQEGIAFSFRYGIDIMREMGMEINLMRAGFANMFLSDVFTEAVANSCNVTVEKFNTDGSVGAARGAAYGVGYYKSMKETFNGLETLQRVEPNEEKISEYNQAYNNWKVAIEKLI